MANLQATLRARLPLEEGLATLAADLDREIAATTPEGTYLTLLMAALDGAGRTLRYVNAGHNAPFLLRAGGGVEALDSTGRPLGLLPGGPYEERRVALGEGDCLFLYTDGLVEAENPEGEPFGAERIQGALLGEQDRGPEPVLARVEKAFREHRGPAEAADDTTMVVLKVGRGAGS
jgi:sigma-B regulation protein RsbU (phosphoserine phosphatase)